MKKIVTLISLMMIAFTANVFAQVNLESVCSMLSKHPNTTGNFNQEKTLKNSSRTLKSNGSFIFSMDGIMWKTEKPFPSTLTITKNSMIQTSASGKKSVTDVSKNEVFKSVSSTLISVFSNDTEVLKKNFNVDFKDEGQGNWKIVLIPRDATVAVMVSSIDLSGVTKNSSCDLMSIVMNEKSGEKITYTFSNQKYPKELSADEKANFIVK